MWSRLIEVDNIFFEHMVQVLFTQNEEVIQAFAADAPHQPLTDRIRPRCLDRRSEHLNPCPCRNCGEMVTILRVIVTNDIPWRFAEGCCFAQLLRDPYVCRRPRNADVNNPTRAELRDDEGKQGSEEQVVKL